MNFWHDDINCNEHFAGTQRIKPFCVIGYSLDYTDQEDKELIDKIISDSENLARHVNAGAANNAVTNRSHERLLANCIAGVLSEYCWRHFLNYAKATVRTTPYTGASTQIDLEVIANGKKIEVRSSFPRNGVRFAICHPIKEFDILGPYSNAYKPGEVYKDYFVRTLFHLDSPLQILNKLRSNNFELYLTGGATHEMMFDDTKSFEKDLIPEDALDVSQPSKYRVVPFHNALDCREIYRMITTEQ